MFDSIIPYKKAEYNIQSTAAEYIIQQGWQVIPLPRGQKKPIIDGWQNLRIQPEEIKDSFKTGDNVGVLLGEPSGGLVDIDLDTQTSCIVAPYFLPPTGAMFGREGKPNSHWLYVSPRARTRKFQFRLTDQKDPTMYVELRSTGGQTVFPPSIHTSGERVTWTKDGKPAEVEKDTLLKAVSKVAAASLLAEYWPGQGSRQDTAMSLAGGLVRANWDEPNITNFIEAVVNATGDEETRSRLNTIEHTIRKYKEGSETTGWPRLAEIVPGEVVGQVRKWLGLEEKQFSWPEPEPIETTLLTVEELPPEIIPGPIREWAVDVSYRMQCPFDFIAVAVMVMVGAVIGAGCGIRPKRKDDWLVIPNLWGGVIGRPGALKTPALQETLKPLSRLEVEAKKKYDGELKYYEAGKEVFKAQREAIKEEMKRTAKGKSKGKDLYTLQADYAELEEPDSTVWRRYKTNDSTIEKMSELLGQNPRGILLFRDELIGLFSSWDKEGREPDRAFYLEAWNGYGSKTTDRIGRGTVHVDNLCVSILGGIQPAKLLAYLYQAVSELENDGLIQRMQLLVYPDEPANWKLVDEYPDQEAEKRVFNVIKTLTDMNFKQNDKKIPYLHFNNEAQRLFNRWLTELQAKLQADENPVMLEHLNKYRSLMPALALIDHLINLADGQTGDDVPLESAKRAAAWCDYLESHARRIYDLVGNIRQRAAAELAKKLKSGKLQDGFTLRDVYRNGWHLLIDKETVQKACAELEEAGWLQKNSIQIPGRQPKVCYNPNPKIFPQRIGQQTDKADSGN